MRLRHAIIFAFCLPLLISLLMRAALRRYAAIDALIMRFRCFSLPYGCCFSRLP